MGDQNLKVTSKNKKGFTLIELLISLGIMAIVVGIGGDILASVIGAYQKAELFGLVEKNGNYALSLMEQDIRKAVKVEIEGPGPNNEGDTLHLTIPKNGDTVVRSYKIIECDPDDGVGPGETGDSTGSLRVNKDYSTGDTLSDYSVIASPDSNSSIFNNTLYTKDFESLSPFTRIEEEGRFDIVYVSFVMGNRCDDDAEPLTEAYFQTSINLRGGLQ